MSTPHEVASSFIPAFFELLASNPTGLAEMYSRDSSFLVVDYELGTSEAHGVDVPKAVEQWAQIVQKCQLSVDSYTAEPLYSGVCVHVSMTATAETVRHFFQFVTVLEACSVSACDVETYFIRHQMITRSGSMAMEVPAEEPVAEPEEEAEPAVEETPEPPVEEPAPVPTPKKSRESPASAHVTDAAPAPAPPRASKPKTWASLASAPPSKTEPRQPVKVISATNGSKADLTEAAAAPRKQETRDAATATATATGKPHGKAPRGPPPAPVGDRLMFNIGDAVSDDDIRAALGSFAAHIVSLRNNSKKGGGCVFLDFAANEKVMDALRENPPAVGPNKTRVNVYRQKPRE